MSAIPEGVWDKIIEMRARYARVLEKPPVASVFRWLQHRFGLTGAIYRRVFSVDDGQYILLHLASKNHVFSDQKLSEFQQGERAAIMRILQYVYQGEVKLIKQIKAHYENEE